MYFCTTGYSMGGCLVAVQITTRKEQLTQLFPRYYKSIFGRKSVAISGWSSCYYFKRNIYNCQEQSNTSFNVGVFCCNISTCIDEIARTRSLGTQTRNFERNALLYWMKLIRLLKDIINNFEVHMSELEIRGIANCRVLINIPKKMVSSVSYKCE